MNYQELEKYIQMEIDKTLSNKDREILFTYLKKAPDIKLLYEQYTYLDSLLKEQLPIVDIPTDFKAGVMARLNNLTNLTKSSRVIIRKRYISRIAIIASAAALLLIIGLSGWFNSTDSVLDSQIPIASSDNENSDEDKITDLYEINMYENNYSDIFIANSQISNSDENGDSIINSGNDDNEVEKNDELTTYAGGIPLPQVAHSSVSHGSYSLYTLASNQDFDAILPRINGDIVTYYLVANDFNLEWQTNLNRNSDPVFVGEIESLPSAFSIAKFKDQSNYYGYTYVSAVSSDGMYIALNQGGENAGFWITNQISSEIEPKLVDPRGGGFVVSWSPDSYKILYTTKEGFLHLYYPEQDLNLTLFEAPTSYVCWANDSKNIVFSALDIETGHLSIFSVIVP